MSVVVPSRDSLLTTSSGYTNYRGILNLVIILLVLSNARAALENIIKYGILVDPLSWILFFSESSKHLPALLIVLNLGLHILNSLYAEKLLVFLTSKHHLNGKSKANTSESTLQRELMLYFAYLWILLNLFLCISLPPIFIQNRDTHPISTSAALMIVSIVFLKLVSYHMVNYWSRDLRKPKQDQSVTTLAFIRSYVPPVLDFNCRSKLESEVKQQETDQHHDTNNNNNNNANDSSGSPDHSPASSSSDTRKPSLRYRLALKTMSKYPANVTLRDLCSFVLFPTLCYELEFARTERIRKRFLIKRLVELLILSQLDIALVQQWIVPTVSNSVLPFRQMQFSHMLERLLKLAIPNHVIWLIWFYLFFHSLLNIAAELTRFADREFYRDWWNSESVYYFWSNWNLPVHKWCARHLYIPLMSLGLNKCQASTAVFFVSAFFHEYLVSVPLKMFRMWAFTGMLMQLPLARFVSAYFNNQFANVAVWVSLILGQPLCILMYYHDYYVINNTTRSPLNATI